MMESLTLKAAFTVDPAGTITGLAWPFGSADRVGDAITKGAFAKARAPLPMLAFHEQRETVGVWSEIVEAEDGLRVKGQLLVDDVERAREIRALIQVGALGGPQRRLRHEEGGTPEGWRSGDQRLGPDGNQHRCSPSAPRRAGRFCEGCGRKG